MSSRNGLVYHIQIQLITGPFQATNHKLSFSIISKAPPIPVGSMVDLRRYAPQQLYSIEIYTQARNQEINLWKSL